MGRPRGFDEEVVLTAARDAFWASGFAGTSVDDLVAATGLGKGSLYGAFGTKRDVYLRVFDEYCSRASRNVTEALHGPADSAMERLSAYLRRAAALTARDTDRRGCFLANGTAELSATDPAVVERAARAVSEMEAQLVRTLRQARRQGELTTVASVPGLARTVLAAVRGMEALGKAGATPQTLRDIAETTIALLRINPTEGAAATARTGLA